MLIPPLHVHQCGHGADLVLLHGWGMHSGVWQPLLPLLEPHFRVTCIDLPGHGYSAFPDNSPTLTHVLAAIMAVAPTKAIWCGWSLGGLLLQQLAYDYPDRISALYCIASTPYFIQQGTWPGLTTTLLHQFFKQLTANHQQTIERFMALQCLGLTDERQQQRQIQAYLAEAPTATIGGLTAALTWLTTLDCRDILPKLSQPIYYLFGRLDTIVPVSVATAIMQQQPQAQCEVIAKAAHMPFISHPHQCAAWIKAN